MDLFKFIMNDSVQHLVLLFFNSWKPRRNEPNLLTRILYNAYVDSYSINIVSCTMILSRRLNPDIIVD